MAISAQGTGADNRQSFTRPCEGKDLPRFEEETCAKMRIEQSKKEHDEMLKRSEEVRQLSERLERSFVLNGKLSSEDRNLLESLEKNVRKIRSELGGSDDDEKIDDVLKGGQNTPFADAVDTLKNTAVTLADEVNKTTRFSISAAAIQSSNAVLAVARFLRVKN
jgi:hypothetical protein